jgi:hypothetical protein
MDSPICALLRMHQISPTSLHCSLVKCKDSMATSNTAAHCFFVATSGLSTLEALNNLSLSSRSMNSPVPGVQIVMPRFGEMLLCSDGKEDKLCSLSALYPVAAATLKAFSCEFCFVNASKCAYTCARAFAFLAPFFLWTPAHKL